MKPELQTLIGLIEQNTPEATSTLPRIEIGLHRQRRGTRETTYLRPDVLNDTTLATIAQALVADGMDVHLRRKEIELVGNQLEHVAVALVLHGWQICLTEPPLEPPRR